MMYVDFEIRYKKGSEMPADYLSRSFTQMSAISVFDMNWTHEHEKDKLSNLIKESLNKKWIYKFPMPDWFKKAQKIANMAIMKNNITWMKENDKLKLQCSVHGYLFSGHERVKKFKERLIECYFWLHMDDDILPHIKECLKCQATKHNKFPKFVSLQPMPQCSSPNQGIHIDLFGPCKTSDMRNKYILTITDALTKYAEICALSAIEKAKTMADMVFTK
jgi:hypothetical protein